MFLVEFIDKVEERFADLFAEFYSFFDLFSGCSVVLLVEVEISVHVELDCFEDLNIVVSSVFDHLIVLNSDVDVRQFSLVPIV